MRNMCSLMTAISLLFGPTVAFANSTNPPSPPFKTDSTQGGSGKTCNNNPGCTTTYSNPQGNNCTCISGPDHKCGC